MKASDLTRGDWVKRDGHEFQVYKVTDDCVYIGNRGQSYSIERVNKLLALDGVEVEEGTGIKERVGTGWA